MRKLVGWVLSGLGMFLIVTALLMKFWAPGSAERTPLNVDSRTHLTGEADKLDPATGKVNHIPVKVTNLTSVDPKKSDGNTIVFISRTCVVIDRNDVPDCVDADDPDGRLVTASSEAFAADRHTGLAVNDTKYVNDGQTREGLVNKWPFETQKKDYKIWDDMLGQAVPVKYTGEKTIDGLKVYQFDEKVEPTKAEVVDGVEGLYSTAITYMVEPVTGSIVDQQQHQVRELPDGSTVLDMSIKYTDDQVKSGVKDGKANKSSIELITGPIWIALLLVGLVLVGIGLVLVRRAARETTA